VSARTLYGCAVVSPPLESAYLLFSLQSFSRYEKSGLAFLERKLQRQDRDAEVSEQAATRQREAIGKYISSSDGVLDYLKGIRQPTLVVQGSNDVIIPTMNSYVLQQQLPNAQLIVYPDSNHGSFYQYPELFLKHATLFLDA
jgi:pimeloyl-ACP methyl ester carboxylesterase